MRTYSQNGELEILDVKYGFKGTDIIPHPGLTDWKVMIEDKDDKNKLNIIKDINVPLYIENNSLINRFFPNDNDINGFFITLIKKTINLKNEEIDKNIIVKPNINKEKTKNEEERLVHFAKDKFPEKITWIKILME